MKPSPPRYVFVDALRGIASVAVLLAHIVNNEISHQTLNRIVPLAVKEFYFGGNFGVQVFFVLSGFVIALSLGQRPLTAPRGCKFALRLQIRPATANSPCAVNFASIRLISRLWWR